VSAFKTSGYVVVRDVLTSVEVSAALDELWNSKTLLGRAGTAIRKDDSKTWGSSHWPQGNHGRNFLESVDPFKDRTCWELAQHPHVVHLMSLLYGGRVFVDHVSRWGVMRPTEQHPEWRTDESWLHWDQNPWSNPEFKWVQAFACLTDQTSKTGGLLCVPGFHHRYREWGEAHPEGTVIVDGRRVTRDFGRGMPFPIPYDDPMQAEVNRILAPAGSLVMWDSRLPHQNFPNAGADFRVVHYLSFRPADPEAIEERRALLKRKWAVMCIDGSAHEASVFPRGLTELGLEVLAAPKVQSRGEDNLEDMDPHLVEAIRLTIQAGEAELQGDLPTSIKYFERAEKTYRDIGKWHDAIFGS